MSVVVADVAQKVVRPLDYRRIVALGYGYNVPVNHIGYFIRIVYYKFLCPLAEIIKIGKHLIGCL